VCYYADQEDKPSKQSKENIKMTIEKDAAVVVAVLKERGLDTKLSDIVRKTEDEINWGYMPSNKMKQMMEVCGEIIRPSKGYYGYKPKSIDAKLEKIITEGDKKLEEFKNQVYANDRFINPITMKRWRVGETVKGIINGFELFGVFVDIGNTSGLIHMSRVRKGRQISGEDLRRYFRLGDKVEAKIDQVKPDGKLSLTTIDTDLPDYRMESSEINPVMAEKLAPIEQQIKQSVLSKDEEHLQEVFTFMQSIVGVVSTEAKERIKQMVKQHGMFPFMLNMAAVAKDFKVDAGLMFAKEIDAKLRDSL
jgi:predicted RNA-binding protein with RPS1 domain